jgi:hypothetical protein
MTTDRIRRSDLNHWSGLVNWRLVKVSSMVNFRVAKAHSLSATTTPVISTACKRIEPFSHHVFGNRRE